MRVWDAVGNIWLSEAATHEIEITIAPDAALLATFIPGEQKRRFEHGRLYVGNIIADYSAPAVSRRGGD